MSAASTVAVAATDLVKSYATGRRTPPVRALAGLTLEVGAGTVFALLGPNGAGKTTAVKVLTTLAHADGGSATVAGVDVARDPDEVRRLIGLVSRPIGYAMSHGSISSTGPWRRPA